ncbi:helix-turn-helix domain-containing protein [Azospirillum sp.]|uniref:helix-turn-helix domain-containing protein n=1 Tax=Azospirillum sp. TaxID=34012 RepID=UPI003D727BE0
MPNTPILTVEDIATFLRLPRSTAYKACKDGTIPCVRFGRHIRISRQKFLDWLASK